MARSQAVRRSRQALFDKHLEVKIDSDGQLQVKCHRLFARELRQILREISTLAREIVDAEHSKTRRLAQSIKPSQVTRVGAHRIKGTVTAGSRRAPYAKAVHEGSKPHIIRARPGGVLAFQQTGRVGPSRQVRIVTGQRIIRGKLQTTYGGSREEPGEALPDRGVVVQKVFHPGYRGHRFLNQAAAIVVGRRYGGQVNLGSGRFGRNNATWQRW